MPVVALVHQVAREVWWYEAPLPAALLGRFVLERHWLRRYRHTAVLTVSESSRQSLADFGLHRVSIVPEGVDVTPRTTHPAKAAEPTLVFCGRMVRSKRPQHAIAAFTAVRERFPDARLVLIGTGPLEARLRKRAPDGVEFVGRVSQDRKYELMARAHAIVATSVREGWGLVVSEAAALGTASVAYDVAGLRDSVAAAGGWLSRPAPDALGDLIGDLLPMLVADPPAPRPWGGAASWDDVADAFLAHARAAVGLCRSPVTDELDSVGPLAVGGTQPMNAESNPRQLRRTDEERRPHARRVPREPGRAGSSVPSRSSSSTTAPPTTPSTSREVTATS